MPDLGKDVEFILVCGKSEDNTYEAAEDIKKTVKSAISNAENNYQYDIDSLFVKEAFCGKQIIMKRFRARAKGRAAEIMKPYSNLTIILSEQKKQMEKDGTKS